MGNRISGYTQTYKTVRKTIKRSPNTYIRQRSENERNPNCQPDAAPEYCFERPERTLVPTQPQPQEKPKQSEPLRFPLERTRQASGQNRPRTSVKPAEQHKQKKPKQQKPPQPKTKPKAKPQSSAINPQHTEYAQPNLHTKRSLIVLLAITAVALLAAIGALLVVREYAVTGVSMEPTLMEGDKLYYTSVQNVSYGDVVIFDTGDAYGLVVKRVIGLPGDTIQINADGTVVRNMVLQDEPYMQKDAFQNSGKESVTVEDGKVFLMGDNRAESIDSRDVRIGQIPINSICGEVRMVVRGVG